MNAPLWKKRKVFVSGAITLAAGFAIYFVATSNDKDCYLLEQKDTRGNTVFRYIVAGHMTEIGGAYRFTNERGTEMRVPVSHVIVTKISRENARLLHTGEVRPFTGF